MSEWVDVKERYPPSGSRIRIKVYSQDLDEEVEIEALYDEEDLGDGIEIRKWNIGKNKGITSRPTHWMEQPALSGGQN